MVSLCIVKAQKRPLFNIIQNESSLNSLSIQSDQPQSLVTESDQLSIMTLSSSSSFSEEKQSELHSGRWSEQENKMFLEGVLIHGSNWKRIQSDMKTRTSMQIRSHAQKIFKKIKSKGISNINLHITTIQDFFEVIKKFPKDQLNTAYNELFNLCNDEFHINISNSNINSIENNIKTITSKECNDIIVKETPVKKNKIAFQKPKKKIFQVLHKSKSNKETGKKKFKIYEKKENLTEKSCDGNQTFHSTSPGKKEEDNFLEELLHRDFLVNNSKNNKTTIVNEENELDFSNLC